MMCTERRRGRKGEGKGKGRGRGGELLVVQFEGQGQE